MSYVGELGWELYVSADMARHAFEVLYEAGSDHGLRLVSHRAHVNAREIVARRGDVRGMLITKTPRQHEGLGIRDRRRFERAEWVR